MDVKLLNPACRLALDVARDGLLEEPSIPAPTALHRFLGFKKYAQTTLASIRKVVDGDDEFRLRVAAEADESEVGRAGWLWLNRPEGWEAELDTLDAAMEATTAESAARLRKKLEAAEATARRHANDAEAAVAARLRVEEKLADLVARAEQTQAHNEDLESEVQRLGDERTQAVRSLKKAEADLADARRDLKLARQANVEAHAELLVLQERSDPTSRPPAESYDTAAVRRAVDHAAQAAATLSEALADAASALVPPTPPSPSRGSKKQRRTTRRAGPSLPPGVFEGSKEANRHLVTTPGLTVVVDAYNVARTAWSDITPEEERRRTVALLEEVQARSGVHVVAMFDGDSTTVAPVASRSVRVRFSPTGVTADDAIAELLGTLPTNQPVLVVSSDKAVASDARRQGAAVMSSNDFLVATGR
ncbi:MAG: NYN domain-containing protein [Aquihabitans sp.]